MRLRVAVPACLALLVVLVSACGGDDPPETLSAAGFKAKVVSAVVSQTDYEAEAAFGQRVKVTEADTPNWLRLSFAPAYAKYRRAPDQEAAILAEVAAEAKSRMVRGIESRSFEEVQGEILPLLKPRNSLRRFPEDAVSAEAPGSLAVAFGVHGKDQFTLVRRGDVDRWHRQPEDLLGLALENLERQTNRDEPLLCEPAEQGELCGWASGDGYDASRMLVPGLRKAIVRKIGPSVYAVPREDVFVALPLEFADRIREKVLRDFTVAPNPVSPDLFVERRGQLIVLGK